MRVILGDPEKAVEERRRKRAKVLTFGALLPDLSAAGPGPEPTNPGEG